MLERIHDLTPIRQVTIDGTKYLHRACKRCLRDFALVEGSGEVWRPVKVNVFNFEFLDDGTAEHWLVECPAVR